MVKSAARSAETVTVFPEMLILGILNGEKPDIDAKADKAVRSLNLVRAHILRQQKLAAVLEIERLAGGVQLRQGLQKVHIQAGPLLGREGRRQHIGGHNLIPALPEDPVPILLAVPHLAQEEGVKALAIEAAASHHHQLHRGLRVLELRDMLQGGKARRLFVVAEALHRSDVFLHHSDHSRLVRHGHLFSEQHLNEIGTAGLEAFFVIQVLLEHLIAHLVSTS